MERKEEEEKSSIPRKFDQDVKNCCWTKPMKAKKSRLKGTSPVKISKHCLVKTSHFAAVLNLDLSYVKKPVIDFNN